MLKHDKLIVMLVFCACISCTNNKNEIFEKYTISKNCSERVATSTIYNKVYRQATDSVNNWVTHGLRSTYDKWRIDSLICFNNSMDKVVMSINAQSYYPSSKMDDLQFFYGVKIKNKWYFFTGATCYLPRENYTKDIRTPLSFAKLHEIAMKEAFSGYLIEKKTKKDMGWWKNIFAPEYNYSYEINDKWFDCHFKASWGYYKNDKFITPSTQREWDSLYVDKAISVWRK